MVASADRPKSRLRLVKGGGKARPRDPVKVPIIGIVSPEELSPARGLDARSYLVKEDEDDKHLPKERRGRSRVVPELEVLTAARAWYTSMLRLARSEGFTSMKNFFSHSRTPAKADAVLFEKVEKLLNWERSL